MHSMAAIADSRRAVLLWLDSIMTKRSNRGCVSVMMVDDGDSFILGRPGRFVS